MTAPVRADAEAIARLSRRLRALYSASVYDVMAEMGLPNQCLDVGIRPLDPAMVVAGPAYGVVGAPEPRTDDEYQRPNMAGFAMLESIPPGHVVLVQAAGERRTGHWGELMSTAARSRGATGIVIDGGTRDAPLLRRIPDWPVFARYTTPVESNGTWQPYDFGVPISVTGTLTAQVRVDPGDWLFGDEDGVLVIPRDVVEEVTRRAERVSAEEDEVREALRTAGSFQEVFDKYRRF